MIATLEEKRKEKAKFHYRKKWYLMRQQQQAKKNVEKTTDKYKEVLKTMNSWFGSNKDFISHAWLGLPFFHWHPRM